MSAAAQASGAIVKRADDPDVTVVQMMSPGTLFLPPVLTASVANVSIATWGWPAKRKSVAQPIAEEVRVARLSIKAQR